jgi:uncharacterized SAM-binding protein YcdF (DUF218 family)
LTGPKRSQTSRRNPAGRSRRRHSVGVHRKRLGFKLRLTLAAVAVILCLLASGVLARHFALASNTALTHFDVILVLGSPADRDGNPKPELQARVAEGVREYERGVAPKLILSGGAAHNRFVEAQVMARTAQAQGIPASAIVLESQAMDTIQNACYATRIMKAHNWHSAEVVSSAAHLPRAGLILSGLPIEWRSHAAPPLSPHSAIYSQAEAAVETLKTVRYLVWSRWIEGCEP